MNPFTALKKISRFHFISLHFFSLILSNLRFTLLRYSYLQLTPLNFTSLHFLSPSFPLRGFHFPNPRFENTPFVNTWTWILKLSPKYKSKKKIKYFWYKSSRRLATLVTITYAPSRGSILLPSELLVTTTPVHISHTQLRSQVWASPTSHKLVGLYFYST